MQSIFIVHEGSAKKTADNELIRLLLEHLGLATALIEFRGMGSKSNFFKTDSYSFLKQAAQTDQIEKILFIVDADDPTNDSKYGGRANAQAALTAMIADLGFQDISQTYIMCDPETGTGYLESLILSSISPTERQCIQHFLNCSNFQSKENHKAILHQIYKTAYPNAPYNFGHPHFDGLKSALTYLFT
ncbi:hypothetical protein [Methylovulum psychrotolerans]|uniref:DUF4276 domain-containing protein n=1 Tax=Methylovulum psychrotolerans TaxID=1704499 RepID=A0A2S5CQ05_9GAMM|nr:hypothetical protein [Methylovulum psychrotolerans]POZ52842.1 hypothetical protein AADEFJLK_01451 [Methylovulum psychrotolerans]